MHPSLVARDKFVDDFLRMKEVEADELIAFQIRRFEAVRKRLTEGFTIYGYIGQQDAWSPQAIFNSLLNMKLIPYLINLGYSEEEADIARNMIVSGAWHFKESFQTRNRNNLENFWDFDLRNFAYEECRTEIYRCRFKPMNALESLYEDYKKRHKENG